MAEEQPSLEALYTRYGHAVHRRCAYLLGEDGAWDATQDVFMKVERAKAKFAGRSSWGTWVTRIATNHCLNQLRARKVRLGRGRVDVDGDVLVDELRTTGHSEAAVVVRQLMAHFDVETQALAVHYYVDEMSQEECALAVGLSVPTVRKRLRIFTERSRRLLMAGEPGWGRAV